MKATAVQYWARACEERERGGLTKQIRLPKKQFRYASEFTNRWSVVCCCLLHCALHYRLDHTPPHYIFVHHTAPHSTTLHYTPPFSTTLHLTALHSTFLHHTAPHWPKLYLPAPRAELEAVSLDLDSLRLQSLIICERILGTQHKDMIYRLMYRGAAYADSLQYHHCIGNNSLDSIDILTFWTFLTF